jgi:hypothetical protein
MFASLSYLRLRISGCMEQDFHVDYGYQNFDNTTAPMSSCCLWKRSTGVAILVWSLSSRYQLSVLSSMNQLFIQLQMQLTHCVGSARSTRLPKQLEYAAQHGLGRFTVQDNHEEKSAVKQKGIRMIKMHALSLQLLKYNKFSKVVD